MAGGRWAALLTALALLAAAAASGTADAAPRAHPPKQKQRGRIGLAKRVAVDRGKRSKRGFVDRRVVVTRPRAALGNDAIGLAREPSPRSPPAPPPPSPKPCTEVVADAALAQARIRAAA